MTGLHQRCCVEFPNLDGPGLIVSEIDHGMFINQLKDPARIFRETKALRSRSALLDRSQYLSSRTLHHNALRSSGHLSQRLGNIVFRSTANSMRLVQEEL